MTQNLDLAGPIELTPDDTQITSNYNLPSSNCSQSYYPNNSGSGIAYYCNASNGEGNYYNWYAMTAGSGTTNMSSGEALYSICPKGWKLPSQSEMQSFINNYPNVASAEGAPVNMRHSGWCSSYKLNSAYDAGCPGYVGRDTCYPTSTAANNQSIMSLHFRVGSEYGFHDNGCSSDYNYYATKATGLPVRCIHS